MATSTLIPVEEYLRTDYSPDCDYLDGEVKERELGDEKHSTVQQFFAMFFGSRRRQWGIRTLPEVRLRIGAERFRVAEVSVRRLADATGSVVDTPPLICVEVLSEGQTLNRVQTIAEDYYRMGVRNIWVVDPVRRVCWVADAAGKLRVTEEDFRVEGTEIRVPIEAIWQELDDLAAGR